jgi:hypothetical protein
MTGEPKITHEGLCDSPHCPFPSDPDWHHCFVCNNPQGDHHHVEKRSQRPDLVDDPTNIVFLCRKHHDKIDNDRWTNKLIDFPDGSIHYVVFDLHGKSMADRVVQQGRQEVAGDLALDLSKDEMVNALPPRTLPAIQEPNIVSVTLPVFPRGVTANLVGLQFDDLVTYEEWAAIGLKLALLGDWLPWAVGDWLKHGEWAYGEKYAQAASETGLKEGRLQQYQWVSEHVQSCTRAQFSGLHWTHFRQVAHLDTEKQQEWLQKAQDEKLTTSELHRAIQTKELPAGPECPDAEDGQHHYLTMCSACGHLR